MDRPSLSRGEIFDILVADAPWHPLQIQEAVQEDDESDASAKFRQRVHQELADVCSNRLLVASWSGTLLDGTVARQRILSIGRRFGWFDLPLLNASGEIESATADVLLATRPVDLVETHAARWDRLHAIVQVAQMYQVKCVPDFVRSGVGREMILRLSTTPEAFREHQRELMDAKRPEVVEVHINRLNRAVQNHLRAQTGAKDLVVRLLFGFPRGSDFWAARAWWMHWVEKQIERAWPGCALGSAQASTTDA